jgi:CRP-like cAMP-binding protein
MELQKRPGFFQGMKQEILSALVQRASYQGVGHSEVIFSQGMPAQGAYLLVQGEASIYRVYEGGALQGACVSLLRTWSAFVFARTGTHCAKLTMALMLICI